MTNFDIPPLVPELQVKDFAGSLSFYQETLGFIIEYGRPENKFAMISLEKSWLMIEQAESFGEVSDREFIEERQWRTGLLEYPLGRGINFQILISDVDKLYARLNEMSFPIKVPIENRWYRAEDTELGVRQFLIMDPDGYLLRFQQKTDERPYKAV